MCVCNFRKHGYLFLGCFLHTVNVEYYRKLHREMVINGYCIQNKNNAGAFQIWGNFTSTEDVWFYKNVQIEEMKFFLNTFQ